MVDWVSILLIILAHSNRVLGLNSVDWAYTDLGGHAALPGLPRLICQVLTVRILNTVGQILFQLFKTNISVY